MIETNKEITLPTNPNGITVPIKFHLTTKENLLKFIDLNAKHFGGDPNVMHKLKTLAIQKQKNEPFLPIEKVGVFYNNFADEKISNFFKNIEIYKVLGEEEVGYVLFNATKQMCVQAGAFMAIQVHQGFKSLFSSEDEFLEAFAEQFMMFLSGTPNASPNNGSPYLYVSEETWKQAFIRALSNDDKFMLATLFLNRGMEIPVQTNKRICEKFKSSSARVLGNPIGMGGVTNFVKIKDGSHKLTPENYLIVRDNEFVSFIKSNALELENITKEEIDWLRQELLSVFDATRSFIKTRTRDNQSPEKWLLV
jgi:hypothetical protein